MNHQLTSRDRQLIPRWRSLTHPSSKLELAEPAIWTQPKGTDTPSRDFNQKLSAWRTTPTLVSAAELVGASLVEAKEKVATGAARLLISEKSRVRPLVLYLAEQAICRAEGTSAQLSHREISLAARKHQWRERTRIYPENALAWVELSLCEVIDGKDAAAKRAMTVALQLAPDNRHIVRSASRLFVHLRDWMRAYDTVAKCGATAFDPWLISAEIAIASLMGRNPRWVKQGRRLLESSQYHPRQISELAGALGTLESTAGRRKKARDLFKLSVIDPTGNTVAQLEWMAYRKALNSDDLYRIETLDETEEAMTYQLGRKEKLEEIPNFCKKWLDTEPFASRPYVVGSTALTIGGQWCDALKFIEEGLRLHPRDDSLLNNYAFALAHLGRFPEALRALDRLDSDEKRSIIVSKANRGLISMRMKNYEKGAQALP